MTIKQIIAALGGVSNQQASVDDVWLECGFRSGGVQVLGVKFTDGSIDYYDGDGKQVIRT